MSYSGGRDSTILTHYRDLLADIKIRVRTVQHKAALSANAEMILMYWDIGRMIGTRQEREDWGVGDGTLAVVSEPYSRQ